MFICVYLSLDFVTKYKQVRDTVLVLISVNCDRACVFGLFLFLFIVVHQLLHLKVYVHVFPLIKKKKRERVATSNWV